MRVRFAGRLVDAYVLERRDASEHDGKLAYLERAVGAEPVLTAETAALFRAVADRWAGNFVDVVRLGVPARHAAGREVGPPARRPARCPPPPEAASTATAPGRRSCAALADGRAGARGLVGAARRGLAGPDRRGGPHRARRRARGRRRRARRPRPRTVSTPRSRPRSARAATSRCRAELGPGRALPPLAGGPARGRPGGRRHPRRRLRPGRRPRAARDLGRRRRPARRAARALPARPRRAGAALGADRRGPAARRPRPHAPRPQQLVETGWAHEIVAERAVLRAAAPRVTAVGDDVEVARDPAAAAARLPSLAWRATREALAAGARCSCRCRAAATCRRWPAPATAHRRGAPSAPGRSPPGVRGGAVLPLVRAAGGGLDVPDLRRQPVARSGGRVRPHGRGARPGVPRRTGAHVRRRPRAGRGRRPSPRSSSRRPAPSRSAPAATARRCCSTAGRCCPGRTCARRRRRCAAGPTRPRSCGPGGTGGRRRRRRRPRRAGPRALGPGRVRRPRARRARRARLPARLTPDGRRSPAPPAAVAELLAAAELPDGAQLIGPVPVSLPHADGPVERVLVRVPRAEGAQLAAGAQGGRGDPLRAARSRTVRTSWTRPSSG